MKIVFMGTPDFAVGALKALREAGHEITLVVTQPDKPKGRGKELSKSPVKLYAEEWNIPTFQPVKLRLPENVEELRKVKADVFVVAAFGQILTKEVLEMPKYGCINIHASLLPMYRGAAPIHWAIINGEKEAGVTIMQMDEGLDTGDMLLKSAVPLAEDETADSLHDKLMNLGGNLIVEALSKLEDGSLTATPQPEGPLFYAKMLSKEMGNLDFTKDAEELERLVRGLNSWPGAYTFLQEKMLKILASYVKENESAGTPGEVISVNRDEFVIQCGKGSLAVTRVKPQAKKEMSVHDFLLGNKITVGETAKNS